VAGWLRQVTQPPFIAGPLVVMRYDKVTSFTELKSHSLHFLRAVICIKNKLSCLGKTQQLWNKK
jgi:uncharacterized protein (DUF362 family)